MKDVSLLSRHRGRRVVEKPEDTEEGDEDDGPSELLEGKEYQAVLPQQRPRPKRPMADEARWLQHRVLPAGSWGDPSRRTRILSSTDTLGRRIMCACTHFNRFCPHQISHPTLTWLHHVRSHPL